jgi:hypothetical protein
MTPLEKSIQKFKRQDEITALKSDLSRMAEERNEAARILQLANDRSVSWKDAGVKLTKEASRLTEERDRAMGWVERMWASVEPIGFMMDDDEWEQINQIRREMEEGK